MRSIQSTGRAAPEQRRVRRTWRRQRATDGGAARRSHGPVPARLTRDENNPMCDRRDANLCDRIRTGDTIDGCPLPYLLTMSLYTLRTLRGSTVVRTRHGRSTLSTDYTTRRFSLSLFGAPRGGACTANVKGGACRMAGRPSTRAPARLLSHFQRTRIPRTRGHFDYDRPET